MEQFTCRLGQAQTRTSFTVNPAAAVSCLARINLNINNTRHSWKAGISFVIINYRILS